MSLTATIVFSWDQIHRDASALAARLAGRGPFDTIAAITRGGLVPAAILAQELGITRVETICVSSYDDRTRGELAVLKGLSGDGAGMLVVDDLVDSGATARLVREMLPRAHVATLYAKPAGAPWADTWATDVDQHVWIVFPWEAPPREE
jgi:xanthine phosphoribosyltransferase